MKYQKVDINKLPSVYDYLIEALKDPEFKKEYDTLEAEFTLINSLISARLAKKLTQSELARRVGMKQAAIARLEGGDSNPRYSTLAKVAKELDKKVILV